MLREKLESTDYEIPKRDVSILIDDKDNLKLLKKELFLLTIDSLNSTL